MTLAIGNAPPPRLRLPEPSLNPPPGTSAPVTATDTLGTPTTSSVASGTMASVVTSATPSARSCLSVASVVATPTTSYGGSVTMASVTTTTTSSCRGSPVVSSIVATLPTSSRGPVTTTVPSFGGFNSTASANFDTAPYCRSTLSLDTVADVPSETFAISDCLASAASTLNQSPSISDYGYSHNPQGPQGASQPLMGFNYEAEPFYAREDFSHLPAHLPDLESSLQVSGQHDERRMETIPVPIDYLREITNKLDSLSRMMMEVRQEVRTNNDRNSNKRPNKEPLRVEELTVSRAFPLKLDGATEEQFAVKCAELLFDQHEWASGNCNGINAPAHDRLKLNKIKDLTLELYSIPTNQQDAVWRRCFKAIDTKGRNLRKSLRPPFASQARRDGPDLDQDGFNSF